MQNNDNRNESAVTGDAHVTSAEGGTEVASSTLSLSELNQYLGRDFKDTASALTALKETQSFVGRRKEDIEREVRASVTNSQAPNANQTPQADAAVLASQVQTLTNDLFYTNNPQFKEYRDIIKAMGANPAEVVGTDAFKKVYEKGKVADEFTKTRSVVTSNSRVGAGSDMTTEAVKVANSRGSTGEDVATILARGILAEEQQ